MDKRIYKQVIVIALVILASIYLFLNHEEREALKPIQITWSFETKELEKPETKVIVSAYGKDYDLGSYEGSCSTKQQENLEYTELSGIVCWWAGGGTEIGLFKEGKELILKKRSVDEGTAEQAGIKSPFEILLKL